MRWASGLRLGLSARAVKRGLLAAVAAGTLLSYVLQLSPLLQWNRSSPPAGRPRSLARLIDRIPETARVAASSHIAPFVARREGLLHFPPLPFVRGFYVSDLDRADYVLALADDNPDSLAQLASNPDFVKEAERARAILYRRRTAEERRP
jgi:hypothetical protein